MPKAGQHFFQFIRAIIGKVDNISFIKNVFRLCDSIFEYILVVGSICKKIVALFRMLLMDIAIQIVCLDELYDFLCKLFNEVKKLIGGRPKIFIRCFRIEE